jgi:hypothetical protein
VLAKISDQSLGAEGAGRPYGFCFRYLVSGARSFANSDLSRAGKLGLALRDEMFRRFGEESRARAIPSG